MCMQQCLAPTRHCCLNRGGSKAANILAVGRLQDFLNAPTSPNSLLRPTWSKLEAKQRWQHSLLVAACCTSLHCRGALPSWPWWHRLLFDRLLPRIKVPASAVDGDDLHNAKAPACTVGSRVTLHLLLTAEAL
jgi:hypothetical protein